MQYLMYVDPLVLLGDKGGTRELLSKNKDVNFLGKFETSSICGKRRQIGRQRIQILSNNSVVDVYLECKDCADIPL